MRHVDVSLIHTKGENISFDSLPCNAYDFLDCIGVGRPCHRALGTGAFAMNTIQLTGTTLDLEASGVLTLTRAQGLRIRCESGSLWVTLEGDSVDHWLQPRQCLTIRSPGRVVIEASQASGVRLLAPRTRVLEPEVDGNGIPQARVSAKRWHEEASSC